MAFYPEPWKSANNEDVEIAHEMWPMETAAPVRAQPDKKHSSVLRRFWEMLLGR